MIVKKLLSAATVAALCLQAGAVTVATTPGNLSADLGSGSGITELTVTGEINAADFAFITTLDELRTLDLSSATVAAYEGTALSTGVMNSPANVLPDYALAGSDVTTLLLPATLTAIGEGAMASGRFASIAIPSGVKSIGIGAFAANEALTTITLPAATHELGINAFQGCTALTTANLASSAITALADKTFQGCSALSAVTLPAGVTTIGTQAFAGCSSLADFTFPAALTTIGNKAFANSGLSAAPLADLSHLTTIGEYAFAACEHLTTVTFPASLTTLGEGAFYSDTELTLTALPQNVTTLEPFAFSGATASSARVMAESSVESIEAYALSDWKAASVIELPASLTYLGDGAMADWSNLSEINGLNLVEVPALGENVWGDLVKSNVTLSVYNELEGAFRTTPQWQDFTIIGGTTDSGATVIDDSNPINVTVAFEGKTLHIIAPISIVEARLYDIQGRGYTLPTSHADTRMDIDTSAFNSGVMIVQVMLSNGSAASFKLPR